MNALATTPAPKGTACRSCGEPTVGWGKDRHGNPRRKCRACKATFGLIPPRPLGRMRLPMDKAVLCLSLLTEGSSIRSTERVSGVHRDTIMRLLRVAGAKCQSLLDRIVQKVEVNDVQADELWCFVGMKEKTKHKLGETNPELGDAYTFVAIERASKLVLAHLCGRRTYQDTSEFIGRLARATRGPKGKDGAEQPYQLSTDGWQSYPDAIDFHLGGRVNYAQLIKTYGADAADERRYSPPEIIGVEKIAISGEPEESRVCTSHVERANLHVRMQMRRFTRLTNAFSRKRENLKAALALHFAAYNFTWAHSTLKGCTPAMVAGIARKPWTMRDVLSA